MVHFDVLALVDGTCFVCLFVFVLVDCVFAGRWCIFMCLNLVEDASEYVFVLVESAFGYVLMEDASDSGQIVDTS